MNRAKQSILIVVIAGIGDLILASKSIRAIRNGFPDADIHLLTNKDAAAMAINYQYVDKVWSLPVRELQNNKFIFFDILKIIHNLRKIDFSIVINLYRVCSWTGSLKMVLLFSLLKARLKVGHDHFGFGILLDKKAPKDTFQNQHFVDAMMEIALLAQGKPDQKGIEVFWNQKCTEKWDHLFSVAGKSAIKIAINPGANEPHKRWDPNKYALVADQLIEMYKAEIILLGGPGEEDIAQTINTRMKNDALVLAGKLSLDDLTYIISRLNLLITNDSGPMHIATAVKTPTVAIFGPEIPIHTSPYTTKGLYRIVQKDVDCRPCIKNSCERPVCLDFILPKDVLIKCHELLRSSSLPDQILRNIEVNHPVSSRHKSHV
jgi:lipopolysaccharide heptosyltransferase II